MIIDAGLLFLMCILAFGAGYYLARIDNRADAQGRRTVIDSILRRDVGKRP